MIFEVKFEVMILVTLIHEVERKGQWFLGVNFSCSNFEQKLKLKFALSLVVFCLEAAF